MSDASGIRRRDFLGTGLVAAGALAFGPGFWRQALAAGTARLGPGPYGELQPADVNGLMLPKGFTSRIVAQANQVVPGTTYRWPVFPDGKAAFAAPDGGYVVVVNSEARPPDAGSSAIRFDRDGKITGAYRILGDTSANCAGGPTPWGTWLSCEETDGGHVWECDPSKAGQGTIRPALGTFNHEAAAVDPVGRRVYLTEDKGDGGFYRFTPARYPDLSEGRLEVAVGSDNGPIRWAPVPDPAAITKPTRQQVDGMAKFKGGEGIWFDSGVIYFATKGDNRIYAHDIAADRVEIVYDRAAFGDGAPLSGLDNVIVSHAGELFVCEDGGDMEMGLVTRDREVARFFRLTGPAAEGSEIAGVTFDPSGRRMYFSSQRALGFGITYEVSGPFQPASPGGGPAGVRTASGGGGAGGGPGGGPGGGAGGGTGGGKVDAPGGGSTGEDVDVRGLRIRAPRRVSLRQLRREGLPVRIELGEAADVAVALRTDDLKRVGGKRGSVDRPVPVTLGRAKREDARKGKLTARVRVGPKRAAQLRRRRSIRARLTVAARDRDGNTRIATRLVRVRITGR